MPRSGAAALRAPLTAALTGRFWVDQASPLSYAANFR